MKSQQWKQKEDHVLKKLIEKTQVHCPHWSTLHRDKIKICFFQNQTKKKWIHKKAVELGN